MISSSDSMPTQIDHSGQDDVSVAATSRILDSTNQATQAAQSGLSSSHTDASRVHVPGEEKEVSRQSRVQLAKDLPLSTQDESKRKPARHFHRRGLVRARFHYRDMVDGQECHSVETLYRVPDRDNTEGIPTYGPGDDCV